MILDHITITGADDDTDFMFLDDMMAKYHHVEWGILFSKKRKGTPRYPSDAWIAKLTDKFYTKFDASFSAHICGSMCERLINEGAELYLTGELIEHSIPEMFKRLQLNAFPEMSHRTDLINSLASGLRVRDYGVILPVPNDTVWANCQCEFLDNIFFLMDSSRGTGKTRDNWRPIKRREGVGYAGGLNPDNIKAVVETLCSVPDHRRFWIDLETGARTDDKFDVKKVEQILKITEEYID